LPGDGAHGDFSTKDRRQNGLSDAGKVDLMAAVVMLLVILG
jgi:hypothetical protein